MSPPPPSNAPFLDLNEVQRRFEREAIWDICRTERYDCSFYSWGTGPPLVFIHGLADDARSFILPISILSRDFRCIAYDLPGGGKDRAKLGRYRHPDLVADFWELLDHLHIEETYVYGSSFGSTIALAAMHQKPHRIPRAVLQGAFAYRPLAPLEVLLVRFARYWTGAMRHLPLREVVLKYNHAETFAHRDPAVWDYFIERCSKPPMATVARRALILHQLDIRALLPQISQPILLVCGDSDPLVSQSCQDLLLQRLPDATKATIENSGHQPYFTHPEVLAELVLRFLSPLSCPAVQST